MCLSLGLPTPRSIIWSLLSPQNEKGEETEGLRNGWFLREREREMRSVPRRWQLSCWHSMEKSAPVLPERILDICSYPAEKMLQGWE
jgi:hypothetical protein